MMMTMRRATRKRLQRRHEVAGRLTPRELQQLQVRLIAGWSVAYRRRLLSPTEAEEFRLQKEHELRSLGADKEMIHRLNAACAAERFSVEDRRRLEAIGTAVPEHLVSNYETVELFELRELRQ